MEDGVSFFNRSHAFQVFPIRVGIASVPVGAVGLPFDGFGMAVGEVQREHATVPGGGQVVNSVRIGHADGKRAIVDGAAVFANQRPHLGRLPDLIFFPKKNIRQRGVVGGGLEIGVAGRVAETHAIHP